MIRSALPERRSARRLLLATLLAALGFGMTLPFLYIYLHEVRGIDPTLVGVVVAWMGLLSLVLAGPTGALLDRFGPRRVLLPVYLIAAIGAFGWGQVHAAWQGLIPATLVAIGNSTEFAGQNMILSQETSEEERTRVFGLNFAVLNLGIGIGGVVGGFIADVQHPASFQFLYAANGVALLLPLLVLLSMPTVGQRHAAVAAADGETGGYREVFANRPFRRLIVFALLLMGCGYAQIEVGLPAFATTVGHVSTRVIAWGLAANTVTIVVGQLFVLRWTERRSRSRALAVAAGVVAVSWLVLAVGGFGRDWAGAVPVIGVVACCVIFASAETIFSPMLPALTNALATDELRGRYNSMSSLVFGVTGIVGPLTAAPLIGHGLGGVWVALIVVGSLIAAVVALSLRPLLTPEQDGLLGSAEVEAGVERVPVE